MKTKICNGKLCKGKEKPVSEFHKDKSTNDGYQYNCKLCKKEYRKTYIIENKQKISISMKKWRENFKQHIKEYENENKSIILKNRRNRRKNNIKFKITCNLRKRIWAVLNGIYKSKTTINLLGCSIEKLKIHLESQFTSGMTWDNYGIYGWHIDHIKPCAKFDLCKESEQLKCFNFKNLQPLWAEDNWSKGSK